MLTGGLRSCSQLTQALQEGYADLLCIGRPATITPDLPMLLKQAHLRCLSSEDPNWGLSSAKELDAILSNDPSPSFANWFPAFVGGSIGISWHVLAMRRIANLNMSSRQPAFPSRFDDIGKGLGDTLTPVAIVWELYAGFPLDMPFLLRLVSVSVLIFVVLRVNAFT